MEFDKYAFRDCRKATGVDGKTFAPKVNISVGTLSRIENGKQKPSHKLIQRMADVLGVPVEAICRQEGQPQAPAVDEQLILALWRKLDIDGKSRLMEQGQHLLIGFAADRPKLTAGSLASDADAALTRGAQAPVKVRPSRKLAGG